MSGKHCIFVCVGGGGVHSIVQYAWIYVKGLDLTVFVPDSTVFCAGIR